MAVNMPETPQNLHGDIGEDYNIRTISSVALIGFLTLILIVIWLKAIWARAERWEWENNVVKAPFSDFVDTRAAEDARLAAYGWTDPAHNKVSEPLEAAMPGVLQQLREDQRQQGAQLATGNPAATAYSPITGATPPGLTSTAPPAAAAAASAAAPVPAGAAATPAASPAAPASGTSPAPGTGQPLAKPAQPSTPQSTPQTAPKPAAPAGKRKHGNSTAQRGAQGKKQS